MLNVIYCLNNLKEHGLNNAHLKIGKPQLEKIVEGYTRESGVRGLEKQIAKMVRYAAKNIAMEENYNVKVSNEDVIEVLGSPRLERDKYENNECSRCCNWIGLDKSWW